MTDYTPKRTTSARPRARSADPNNSSVLSACSTATPGAKAPAPRSHSRTVSNSASKCRKPKLTRSQQSLDESLLSLSSPTSAQAARKEWRVPGKTISLCSHLQDDDLIDVIEETHRIQHQLLLMRSTERKLWWSESRRVRNNVAAQESKALLDEIAQRAEDWKDRKALRERQEQEAKASRVQTQEEEFRASKAVRQEQQRAQQQREAEDLQRAKDAARREEALRRKLQDEERLAAARLREERREAALAAKRAREEQNKRELTELSFDYSRHTCAKLQDTISQAEKAAQELDAESR